MDALEFFGQLAVITAVVALGWAVVTIDRRNR